MQQRVLWLSSETPDVRGGGGQRRQFHHILALLASGIDVSVASVAGPQDDASIRGLTTVFRFEERRRFGRNRDLDRIFKEITPTRAIVAHAESLPGALPNLRHADVPFLLDFHNVHSRWHTLAGEERLAQIWRRRERVALSAATSATVCSHEEGVALASAGTETPIELAPHGVAPEEWPADALQRLREPTLALFGSWTHRPNRIAANWMATQVWPEIRKVEPSARLLLFGPGPPPTEVLATTGIANMGRVDSLAHSLGVAMVAIVPITRGLGARVKFVESLASGAAVVSTTQGAEGFSAEGSFIRADEAAAFAEACIQLLRNPDRATELGRSGREVALTRYAWAMVSQPLIAFARSGP